jgi:hypothetical protein
VFVAAPRHKNSHSLIGGNSRAAIRRAVRLGNGWHPLVLSPEELSQGIRYLREQAQAAGRDAAEISVSISLPLGASTASLLGDSVRGYALGTDPGEIVQKVQTFARMGVQGMVTSVNTGN